MKKLHKDSFLFDHRVEIEYVCAFLYYVVNNCFLKTGDSDTRLGWMACVLADNVDDLDFGVWRVVWMSWSAQKDLGVLRV